MLQLSENARQGEPTQEQFSISELSREFDVTTRAIRFYEDEGLLEPHRQGRQRVYSSRDRIRLKLILRGKRLGFSLSEIGDIIDMDKVKPDNRRCVGKSCGWPYRDLPGSRSRSKEYR